MIFKVYKLNSAAGKNNKQLAGSVNLSVYASWEAGPTSPVTLNPITDLDRLGPGASVVRNPIKDDKWFASQDVANQTYWDEAHIPVAGNWENEFERGFADKWDGLNGEQLRGCSCMSKNVFDIWVVKQPPVLQDKDGNLKQLKIDKGNGGLGMGIQFADGPGGGGPDALI